MIQSLELDGFRNLESTLLQPLPGLTLVCGSNGQGKSNLLEAIHLICQGFSFRTRHLNECIAWEQPAFVLRAQLESANAPRALQVHRTQGTRSKLNAQEHSSAAALFGEAPVIMMGPDDMELVRGAPEIRRRYLDELLCFRKSSNANLLRRFKRVLQQRNRWLKDYKERRPTGGEDVFAVLTQQLAGLSAQLWRERLQLTEELGPWIMSYHHLLSGGADSIHVQYASFFDSIDSLEALYLQKLHTQHDAERRLGSTLTGPHRDDLSLLLGHHPLRSIGSQGQCRCAALALRLAAVDLTLTHHGAPILLLDDIFAELDPTRREAVATVVRQKKCQTFAATPHAADLPFQGDALWKMHGGRITH